MWSYDILNQGVIIKKGKDEYNGKQLTLLFVFSWVALTLAVNEAAAVQQHDSLGYLSAVLHLHHHHAPDLEKGKLLCEKPFPS